MFNRSRFNRLSYNRSNNKKIYLEPEKTIISFSTKAKISVVHSLVSVSNIKFEMYANNAITIVYRFKMTADMNVKRRFDSKTNINFGGLSDIKMNRILYPNPYIIELTSKSDISNKVSLKSRSEMNFGALSNIKVNRSLNIAPINIAFHTVSSFESFKQEVARLEEITLHPNDVLIIDTCKFNVTLNGKNIYENFRGNFFNLEDKSRFIQAITEGSSNIHVKVEYTDKWL